MKVIVSFLPYICVALILGFLSYVLNLKKENGKTNLSPFPYKMFFVFGVFCGLLVPLFILIALTFFYGSMNYISVIAKTYFLFLSNLILINIYTYMSKYLHEIGNKRAEIILSGVFALAAIIVLNYIFLRNIILGKISSTDVFIIFIIPVYGFLSIIVGYFLGGFFKKLNKRDGLKYQEKENGFK